MPFQTGGVALHNDDQHTGSAKRGVASGVGSLDAGALQPDAERPASITGHIAAATPHTGHMISASGTYVGNGTQNRALPHGLGRTPVLALFRNETSAVFCVQFVSTRVIRPIDELSAVVTTWDSTNIYIGAAAGGYNNVNAETYTYRFFA